MAKISIIIPVYNAEKYIRKCLDSILEQSFNDIEVIIVNDGSTDKSESIINEYLTKYDDKVKYYSKPNTGVADTRNYAIERATGDYITFVDSDDYIDKDLYKSIFNTINDNIDIIKIKAQIVDEADKIIEKCDGPIFDLKTGEEAFDILYKEDKLIDALWLYLFRREFYISNKFKFEKNLYHEDFGLIPLIILKAKSVKSLDLYGYYYVQTSQSSITRNNLTTIYKRSQDLLKHYDNMIETIEKYDISTKSKESIKIYFTNCILLEINNLQSKEEKNRYIKEIRKRKMTKNIKARNFKQLIKKIILTLNIKLYLKLRW